MVHRESGLSPKLCDFSFSFCQALCDDLEQTQPQLSRLLTRGHLLLNKVPDDADRVFLESQLTALEELQTSVIRKSLAKQEELIRCIVQQQDFQTQVQSCMHVLQVRLSSTHLEVGLCQGGGCCIGTDFLGESEKTQTFQIILPESR